MNSLKYIQERREKRKRQNNQLTFIMVGGVVVVLAAIFYAVFTSNNVNLTASQITQPVFTEVEQYDLSGLGDPQAPVLVEAYSNFSCSHCAEFALDTGKQIEQEYITTGQVSLVFKTVGYSPEAPALTRAIESAYCAAEQGSFWQFHDLIFANQVRLFTNRAANVTATMRTFAEMLALNLDQFESCIAEEKYQDLVYDNQADASLLGVSGTPTFFINGVKLVGNQPYENFQEAIEQALDSTN